MNTREFLKSNNESIKELELKARLNQVVNLPYEDESIKSWMRDILTHEGGDKEIDIFFENVSKYQYLRDVLKSSPEMFESLFYYLSQGVIGDEKSVESLIFNIREREEEKFRNEKDRHDRVLKNPQASSEEYRLGTYVELLESQVRGAVLNLLSKGYQPMESGFYDLLKGSQYIGINKTEGVDVQAIRESLRGKGRTVQEVGLIARLLKGIVVDETKDRVQIILTPENPNLPLSDWAPVLYNITYLLPDISKQSKDKNILSDNGTQGERFREAQDKIKEGKNTWICPGLAFVDGKAAEISYEDFMRL